VSRIVESWAPGYLALEVGCGTGTVLRCLEKVCRKGRVVGMDRYGESFRFARKQTAAGLIQGDVHAPPFSVAPKLIGLFDVLEHLPDDIRVLRDLYDLLAPDGTLILTVPAHMALWSYSDVAAHHARRYERRELIEKLTRCGFQVERASYFMFATLPVLRFARWWQGRHTSSGEEEFDESLELLSREFRVVPIVNGVLKGLLAWEPLCLRAGITLPTGSSLIAVAKKV